MIRSIAKRMYTPIKNANTVVYPAYNEFKPDDSDDGYRDISRCMSSYKNCLYR